MRYGLCALRSKLICRYRGKISFYNFLNFPQPLISLPLGTGHNHPEHFAIKVLYTAEVKDAVFPDRFKRVSEDIRLRLAVLIDLKGS